MKDSEFYALLDSIIIWKHIVPLNLAHKNIDDTQAIELAAALATNPFIKQIDLSRNKITAVGAKALLELRRDICLEDNDINTVSDNIGDKKKDLDLPHSPNLIEHNRCDCPKGLGANTEQRGYLKKTNQPVAHHPEILDHVSILLQEIAKEIKTMVLDLKNIKEQLTIAELEHHVKLKLNNEVIREISTRMDWKRLSPKKIDKLFCNLAMQYKQNNLKLRKLHAFPNLKKSILVEQQVLRCLVAEFSEAIIPELARCKPRQITNILCTYAVFEHANPKLMQACAEHVINRMSSYNPPSLIRIAWAFATLGIKNELLFEHLDQWLTLTAPRISWANKHKVVSCFTKLEYSKAMKMLPKFLKPIITSLDHLFKPSPEEAQRKTEILHYLDLQLKRQQEVQISQSLSIPVAPILVAPSTAVPEQQSVAVQAEVSLPLGPPSSNLHAAAAAH